MKTKLPKSYSLSFGFTLIEVMMVIVLVGVMISVVQFSGGNNNASNKLAQASARFAGVFDIAAEFSMLNNIELGLFVTETSYQFLGYDGTRWTSVPENDLLAVYTLPEDVLIALTLDDLPIEEPPLFDATTFISEENEFASAELDKEKPLIPQVYLLSGGDITPFRLSFYLDKTRFSTEHISYQVTGIYATPLTIEGPVLDE